MARFRKRLLCFLAIQSVIGIAILKYGAPRRSDAYVCALYDKLHLLATTASPRILLVGGSNVAFGMNSPLIQEQTGLHPINLGLHAGLGLELHLRLAEENVREGDVVVLMPEYGLLNSASLDGQPDTIASFIQEFPEGKRFFESTANGGTWKDFFDRDALRSANQWSKRALCRIFSNEHPVYRRSGFNRYGDMVAHHDRNRGLRQVRPLPKTSRQHLGRAILRINQFSATCREKGAQVYFSFPPLPDSAFQQSEHEIHELCSALENSLDIPIINRPDDLVFPLEHFFDTIYHLNRVAAEHRSRVLVAGLRRHRALVANSAASKADTMLR